MRMKIDFGTADAWNKQITVVDGEARTTAPVVAGAPGGWRMEVNNCNLLGPGRS